MWLSRKHDLNKVKTTQIKVSKCIPRDRREQTTIQIVTKFQNSGIWRLYYLEYHEKCTEISTEMPGNGEQICEHSIIL